MVTVLVFIATQSLPADVATTILGRGATPEQLATLREQLGLTRPPIVQYVSWLGSLVGGNGGESLSQHMPVAEWVVPRFVNSLILIAVGLIPAIAVSIAVGMWLAVKRDSVADRAFMTSTVVVNSLPEFVLGSLLILLLATGALRLFPPVSMFDVAAGPFSNPPALILPALTIFLIGAAYFSRLVRASMIDQLRSEYARTALLRGTAPRRVAVREAFPNAFQPVLQASAVVFGNMLAGSVALETVFNYPGLGAGLIMALNARDLPLIQYIVVTIAVVFVLANLIADIVTKFVTPSARSKGDS